MAEYLITSPVDEASELLAALVAGAAQRAQPGYVSAVDSLAAALSDPDLVPYQTRSALYAAAKRAGHEFIARLFFEASPVASSESERATHLAAERPITPRGRALTLGERKSLARTHRRDLITHLLRDPHPEVVRILLGNPHLTEADVLVIASRRLASMNSPPAARRHATLPSAAGGSMNFPPAARRHATLPSAAGALAVIAADERWSARYPVKLALVQNPYTPVHLAIRLVTTLRAADLRAVAADPRLAAPLCEQARALLALR